MSKYCIKDCHLTKHLFGNINDYNFIESWETFISDLNNQLRVANLEQKLITKMTGKSKILNSIVSKDSYIGDFSLIRNSIIEPGVKIGANVQINMSILRRGCEMPHFNNIAYSFLGSNVLVGSMSTTSSVRLDGKRPTLHLPDGSLIVSESSKYGALIGDDCKIGSHVCINPFTVIEKKSIVMPGQSVSGYITQNSNYKVNTNK